MMYEESNHSRRIFGSLEAGKDLVVALTKVCSASEIRGAEIRAVGTLENVELARFDAQKKQWVTTAQGDGPFDIVSISGNVSRMGDQTVVRADALLAVQAPGGQQLVFGQIRRAKVVDCEFIVDAFADLEIARKLDPATQMLALSEIRRTAAPAAATPTPESTSRTPDPAPVDTAEEPASKPAPKQAKESNKSDDGASWSDAAKASDGIREEKDRPDRSARPKKEAPGVEEIYGDYDFNEPILGAGDILDHPKLGRCRVIKVEDDEYAHIRMSRGQIRKLALSIVDIKYEGEDDDGRNVFKVVIRR
jgi:predicted DNA-binding protein with PD1-like motif